MTEDRDEEDLLNNPATISTNSAQTFAEQKKFNARQGHGFAAERANHIHDIRDGKKAKIVGGNNKKNGPDRNVNGRNIQTKFCKNSADTIRAMLNSDGSLRYMDKHNPMAVEVPKDQYDDIVSKMEQKISNGEIKDITDPKVAKKIIKKSPITYAQSKNIAQFATIDGIVYDVEQATVEITDAKYDIGIGALIVFAHSMWNGEDFEYAIKNSCAAVVKSSIVVGVRSVVLSELSKTPIDAAVKNIVGSKIPIGKNSIARAEVTNSIVTLAILSVPDFIQFVSGELSFSQLCKNVTITASGIAGGVAGTSAGAALGSLIFPGVGTALGSIAGGASTASSVFDDSYDPQIKEAKHAEKILHETLGILSQDFMLTQDDAELMVIEFKRIDRSNYLQEIYSPDDNKIQANVCRTFVPIMQAILASHEHLSLPSINEYNNFLKKGKIKDNFKYESYSSMKSKIQILEEVKKTKEDALRIERMKSSRTTFAQQLEKEGYCKTNSSMNVLFFWLNMMFLIFAFLGTVYLVCSENNLAKPFLITLHLLAVVQMFTSTLELDKLPESSQKWEITDKISFYSVFFKIALACLIVCWLPIGLTGQYFDSISSEMFWTVPTYISISITAIYLLKAFIYIYQSIKIKKIKMEIEKANRGIENYKNKIDNLLSKIHINATKFETQYEPYELKRGSY